MSQDHERSATYSRKYNAALWFYDRNQLNECAESAQDLLDDPDLPRFHRMKTLILLASITGWHDAEDCRVEAEQLWRMARVQYSIPTFDEEEALTELRKQLDALKAAQDYELFGGPPGGVDDGEHLDTSPAGSEDNGADLDASAADLEDDGGDLDASASDTEVERAVQVEGVEEPRSDFDIALPVAQATATATASDPIPELDTTPRAAGVLTPPPSSDVDFFHDMPHRPAHHARDA
ncbi:hypothetical protein LTR33_008945 [Friedmanniomyces endolithicus]|nr:hypothetical protein LTR33_008945 [Friedmanniomyces endolithicus]